MLLRDTHTSKKRRAVFEEQKMKKMYDSNFRSCCTKARISCQLLGPRRLWKIQQLLILLILLYHFDYNFPCRQELLSFLLSRCSFFSQRGGGHKQNAAHFTEKTNYDTEERRTKDHAGEDALRFPPNSSTSSATLLHHVQQHSILAPGNPCAGVFVFALQLQRKVSVGRKKTRKIKAKLLEQQERVTSRTQTRKISKHGHGRVSVSRKTQKAKQCETCDGRKSRSELLAEEKKGVVSGLAVLGTALTVGGNGEEEVGLGSPPSVVSSSSEEGAPQGPQQEVGSGDDENEANSAGQGTRLDEVLTSTSSSSTTVRPASTTPATTPVRTAATPLTTQPSVRTTQPTTVSTPATVTTASTAAPSWCLQQLGQNANCFEAPDCCSSGLQCYDSDSPGYALCMSYCVPGAENPDWQGWNCNVLGSGSSSSTGTTAAPVTPDPALQQKLEDIARWKADHPNCKAISMNEYPDDAINLVLLGSGYHNAKAEWERQAYYMYDLLRAAPFEEIYNAADNPGLNVFYVSTPDNEHPSFDSTQSGCYHGCYNFDRLLCCGARNKYEESYPNGYIAQYRTHAFEQCGHGYHMTFLIIHNSQPARYGGAGNMGAAVVARDLGPVAGHEVAHSLFNLADEYWYASDTSYVRDDSRNPNCLDRGTCHQYYSDLSRLVTAGEITSDQLGDCTRGCDQSPTSPDWFRLKESFMQENGRDVGVSNQRIICCKYVLLLGRREEDELPKFCRKFNHAGLNLENFCEALSYKYADYSEYGTNNLLLSSNINTGRGGRGGSSWRAPTSSSQAYYTPPQLPYDFPGAGDEPARECESELSRQELRILGGKTGYGGERSDEYVIVFNDPKAYMVKDEVVVVTPPSSSSSWSSTTTSQVETRTNSASFVRKTICSQVQTQEKVGHTKEGLMPTSSKNRVGTSSGKKNGSGGSTEDTMHDSGGRADVPLLSSSETTLESSRATPSRTMLEKKRRCTHGAFRRTDVVGDVDCWFDEENRQLRIFLPEEDPAVVRRARREEQDDKMKMEHQANKKTYSRDDIVAVKVIPLSSSTSTSMTTSKTSRTVCFWKHETLEIPLPEVDHTTRSGDQDQHKMNAEDQQEQALLGTTNANITTATHEETTAPVVVPVKNKIISHIQVPRTRFNLVLQEKEECEAVDINTVSVVLDRSTATRFDFDPTSSHTSPPSEQGEVEDKTARLLFPANMRPEQDHLSGVVAGRSSSTTSGMPCAPGGSSSGAGGSSSCAGDDGDVGSPDEGN
ncbi:unnamed protein product [Amoebophrya sp. A120]|nr:unnamed protein product [Amoebophrya sp. A120]|eukprot:GSA120T00014519001.1